MPKSDNERIYGLDVLRALAITLVIMSHSAMLVLSDHSGNIYLTFFKFFGAIGVDLFFVLSGFLIGGILLKHIENGQTELKHIFYFWIRRWFRTLPNYFLILIFNIVLFYILYGYVVENIERFFLFLQNFRSPHLEFFPEAWSLSIEEFAYLIGPFFLLLLVHLFRVKKTSYLFLCITVSVILISVLSRYLYFLEHSNYLNGVFSDYSDWSQNIRKVVIYRIDSIYYGFLTVYVSRYFVSVWNKSKYYALIIGLFMFFGLHAFIWFYSVQPDNYPGFYLIGYLPIVSLSLLMSFPYFSNWKTGGSLSRYVTRLSKISYSLYLVNFSLIYIPIRYLIDISALELYEKLIVLAVYLIASLVLSDFLYRFYEKPIMNLRNHKSLVKFYND